MAVRGRDEGARKEGRDRGGKEWSEGTGEGMEDVGGKREYQKGIRM